MISGLLAIREGFALCWCVYLEHLLNTDDSDLYRIRKEPSKCPMTTKYPIQTVWAEKHSDHCKERWLAYAGYKKGLCSHCMVQPSIMTPAVD